MKILRPLAYNNVKSKQEGDMSKRRNIARPYSKHKMYEFFLYIYISCFDVIRGPSIGMLRNSRYIASQVI